jgi:hypothetical protein
MWHYNNIHDQPRKITKSKGSVGHMAEVFTNSILNSTNNHSSITAENLIILNTALADCGVKILFYTSCIDKVVKHLLSFCLTKRYLPFLYHHHFIVKFH